MRKELPSEPQWTSPSGFLPQIKSIVCIYFSRLCLQPLTSSLTPNFCSSHLLTLVCPTRTISNAGVWVCKLLNLACLTLALDSASPPCSFPSDFCLGEYALHLARCWNTWVSHSPQFLVAAHHSPSESPTDLLPPASPMHNALFFTYGVTAAQTAVTARSDDCKSCFSYPSLPFPRTQLERSLSNTPGFAPFLFNTFSGLPYLFHNEAQTHSGLQHLVRASYACPSQLTSDDGAWAIEEHPWFSATAFAPSQNSTQVSLQPLLQRKTKLALF